MEITIDNLKLGPVPEDYSEYEDDEVIGILADVCQLIDENRIASFSIVFSVWDDGFRKTDFAYDFLSIATELETFLIDLRTKKESFMLHFYELDRKVRFNFQEGSLEFEITNSTGNEMSFHGPIDPIDLEKKVERVLETFKEILTHCFPQALERFNKYQYVFPA